MIYHSVAPSQSQLLSEMQSVMKLLREMELKARCIPDDAVRNLIEFKIIIAYHHLENIDFKNAVSEARTLRKPMLKHTRIEPHRDGRTLDQAEA